LDYSLIRIVIQIGIERHERVNLRIPSKPAGSDQRTFCRKRRRILTRGVRSGSACR
jgi:hypothetical protein